MSKLTDAEIAAKTETFKLLQKELGWVRTNVEPLIIGAVLGIVVSVILCHIL